MNRPIPLKLVLFLIAAMASFATLSACGADSTPTPTTSPSNGDQLTATPTATAVPTASPTPRATATPVPDDTPQLPATVVDAAGNTVTVNDISRIVVLNGDFAEVAFALDLGDNVVAVDTSATYPPEAFALPKIGYQRSLSAEGVLSMDPTVVIGSTSAGPSDVIDQLRASGVTIVILDSVATLDGAAAKIRGIAQALGVPERGEAIASGLEAQIAEAEEIVAGVQDKPSAVFLYMRGLDTLMMAGEGDLTHELFEAAGATSGGSAAGITGSFVPLTAEALVAADPSCIVVFSTGLESVGGRDNLKQIAGVAETTAAQEDCILDFDGQYLSGGGPRTGDVLMELVAAFHPELVEAP